MTAHDSRPLPGAKCDEPGQRPAAADDSPLPVAADRRRQPTIIDQRQGLAAVDEAQRAAALDRRPTAPPAHDRSRRRAIAGGLLLLSSLALGGRARAAAGKKLRIGTTLHPYYSFVANIVGDKAEVTPLIDAGFNPHNYTPRPQDMKRATTLDALVVNGIGHDEFAFHIIEAAGMKQKLRLIYANDGVALIPLAGAGGDVKQVNPHTFVSISAAVQQVYTIARALGEQDRPNAAFYLGNARTYTTRLRRLKAQYMAQLADVDVSRFSCATMHDAYGYLMQEFGLRVAAVIEPRHGVQPTARQLAETIDRIKAANVHVLFAEKYFASRLSDSIKAATGVEIYSFSHISDGEFTADKFEEEMRENLRTLVQAVRTAAAASAAAKK